MPGSELELLLHEVLYTELELPVVTGDDTVEFEYTELDGPPDKVIVVLGAVTSVTVVELLDFTGPEDDPADAVLDT